jgi:hypothetical protein
MCELIKTEKEWMEFRQNTKRVPAEYPVVAWNEYTDFGLGVDGYVSYFKTIPKEFLDAGTADAWVAGFSCAIEGR